MYVSLLQLLKRKQLFDCLNLNEDAYCRVIPLGLKNMIHVIYSRN